MTIIYITEQIRQLINPDRHGGVSGFELRKATELLDKLQQELAKKESYDAERNERTFERNVARNVQP